MHKFKSGATRDTNKDKPNYIKALSPIVLQRYVKYLGEHRIQSDGKLRDWDNWKKGIDIQAYIEGLGRHELAVWLLHQGFPAFDNHGPVTLQDSLCGVIFNAMGYLYELLKTDILAKTLTDYCPECYKKINAAKPGEIVSFCEKCMKKIVGK